LWSSGTKFATMHHDPLHLALVTAALLGVAWVIGDPGRAGAAEPTQQQGVELVLPRPPAAGEAVWLEVRVGTLGRGDIEISTRDGRPIGSVSSFGGARGQAGATYTVPLPQSEIVNGRVQLRLEVDQPGQPARAPKPGEVDGVKLIYVPVSQ